MDSEVGVGDSLTEGRPRGSDLNRAILDSLSGHVFAFDRECRVIFTDERACEALALAPAQVEGKHWADLGMPGEFMLPVEQEIIEVIETGLPIVNSSAHSILEAGLPVGYVVSPMFRRDGSVEGAVLHIRNSDGGPEVVEGYAASGPRTPGARAMHRIILDSVCDRIYAFDRDCRYTFAGEYACRFMGLKLSDLVGKHWSELDVPEQPMRSIERELREVMQTGLPIANSCQYMWQSRSMNIEYTVSPILAGKSHVEGAVVLVREIVSADDRAGELRAYQRAKAIQENDLSDHLASAAGSKALDDWVLQRRLRREATRLHRALLRSISHDYRGPLTAVIASLSELAERGTELSPKLSKGLAVTGLGQAQRLERFLDNLIYAAELDEGRMSARLELEDAGDIVDDVLNRCRGELSGHPVEWVRAADIPSVTVDRSLVVQALVNVVGNAANYSPEDSAIKISCTRDAGNIVFQVEDHGPGIPADFRDEDGKSAESGHGRHVMRRGLGLEIAREICKAHGGWLVVEDREGGGAVVRAVLPLGGSPAIS